MRQSTASRYCQPNGRNTLAAAPSSRDGQHRDSLLPLGSTRTRLVSPSPSSEPPPIVARHVRKRPMARSPVPEPRPTPQLPSPRIGEGATGWNPARSPAVLGVRSRSRLQGTVVRLLQRFRVGDGSRFRRGSARPGRPAGVNVRRTPGWFTLPMSGVRTTPDIGSATLDENDGRVPVLPRRGTVGDHLLYSLAALRRRPVRAALTWQLQPSLWSSP